MNEDLHSELPPWDRGRLLAHQISSGSTETIERSLRRAQKSRKGLLVWVIPGKKRYLDGLISGLEESLELRSRGSRKRS